MTARETLIHVPYAIVTSVYRRGHRAVVRIAIRCSIVYLAAVAVCIHIRIHIGRIVTVVYATGTAVIAREMIPIIGRGPYRIMRSVPGRIDERRTHKYGFDDVIGAIDKRIADYLYIGSTGLAVDYQGGYVLKHIHSQYGL